MGGVLEGKWLQPAEAYQNDSYQDIILFYDLQTLKAKAQGGRPELREAPPCQGAYTVPLDIQLAETYGIESFGWLGLSSQGWNVAPRPAEAVDLLTAEQTALLDDLLAQNGALRLDYQQLSAYRTDLEGDGTEEIILTATALQEESLHMVAPGEYALAALLRGDSAILLVGDFYTAEEMAFPSAYAISAVLDLNGDGKMEVVVHDRHWEGDLLLVYEINGNGARRVLDTCCMEEAMEDERCVSGRP